MTEIDADVGTLIDRALAEDVGPGDWTTEWTVPAASRGSAEIVAKAEGVVAGLGVARAVFDRLDGTVVFEPAIADGDVVRPGRQIAVVRGPLRAILTGERTALNFLQRLSGVATVTRTYVDTVVGTTARILDTRKTTPGWRRLEKAAVRAGGGWNHRVGLHDMVLVKENHIAAAGGIRAAVHRIRQRNHDGLLVEVEVRSLEELDDALAVGVDRVLLDNMDLATMREAVRRAEMAAVGAVRGRPELEASGNMTLERVRAVAETGVDWISVGALTHSAAALDLSLIVRRG